MQIQERIIIRTSADDLYHYLNQVENRKAFIPLLQDIILLDDPPLRVGSRYTEVSTIAGQQLKTTYEVTNLVAPQLISVKTTKSVFPIAVDLFLQAQEEATLLAIQLDFTLKGIYRLAAPVVNGIVRQQAKDILVRLKAEVEKA